MAAFISVKSNLKDFQRSLRDVAEKQIRFAAAQAVTALAREVAVAESGNIKTTFKNPTPFTQKAIGVKAARKTDLTATVFVKPIAAKYLEPYETGGVHKLSSRALLNPKDLQLNAYGQLSKGTLARLKARPDIFIGPIKTAHGVVNGVWQRSVAEGVKVLSKKGRKLGKVNTTGKLKLLLRFGDALPVKQRLRFGGTAISLVSRRFNPVFSLALQKALATAK